MEGYIKKIFLVESESPIVQFFRYSIVGAAASVVDISIFAFLAGYLQLNYLFSNTVSFTIGLLTNYFLSRQWVFNKKEHELGRDFTLFAIIGILGLLLSNLIIYVLIDKGILYKTFYFMGDGMIKTLAKVAATFIVLFWNFIARKKILTPQ